MEVAHLDPELPSGGETLVNARESVPLLRHPTRVAFLAFPLAGVAFTHPRGGHSALIAAFLASVFVILLATDIERRVIPNRVVLPAIALTLIAHLIVNPGSAINFFLAAVAAGAVFLLPSVVGRSWMGMGDVKFIVLLGAGLGAGVVGAVTIAFLSLFPVALWTLLRGGLAARKTALPFGPSLAFGGLVVLIIPHLAGAG
jgi:prepilin signal peptidase PulO-like enzyme (type II secretory pathway)